MLSPMPTCTASSGPSMPPATAHKAAPTAKIGFVQAAMGVSCGFGGARRLVERIGRQRAVDVLTRARPMAAAEAERLGLVDEVVAAPLARALERAEELAGLPLAAMRAVKPLVHALPASTTWEAEVFAGLWGGPAHVAALDRFRAR